MEPRPEKLTDLDRIYLEMDERSMDGYLKAWQKLVDGADSDDKTEEIQKQIDEDASDTEIEI